MQKEDTSKQHPQQKETQPVQPPLSMEKKKSSRKLILILLWILTALIFTGLGAGGYWFLTKEKEQTTNQQEDIENTEISEDSDDDEDEKQDNDNELTTDIEQDEDEDEDETDPYEGWKTYINTEIGYQVKYPEEYILIIDDTLGEECVRFQKGNISIDFGISDSMLCLRTGVGAHEIEKTEVSYNINGEVFTIQEWYEKVEQEDGTFGNIYGRIHLDESKKLDLEYYGHPKETFELERETITKIIESTTF